jgi:hypothetical protein
MEGRLWEEAREKWNIILEEDNDDAEALTGKRKAEEEILNIDMIKLRDLIVSNKLLPALKEAKNILKKIKAWNIKTNYNSSLFFGKETAKLLPFFLKKINNHLSNGEAKNAEETFEEYKVLFSDYDFKDTKKMIIDGLLLEFKNTIHSKLANNEPKDAENYFNTNNDERFNENVVKHLNKLIVDGLYKRLKREIYQDLKIGYVLKAQDFLRENDDNRFNRKSIEAIKQEISKKGKIKCKKT